jgi:hypothetical protein
MRRRITSISSAGDSASHQYTDSMCVSRKHRVLGSVRSTLTLTFSPPSNGGLIHSSAVRHMRMGCDKARDS